jgi:hypothetical protein
MSVLDWGPAAWADEDHPALSCLVGRYLCSVEPPIREGGDWFWLMISEYADVCACGFAANENEAIAACSAAVEKAVA